MTAAYVLQAEDVAIHYGGVKALDGVALTLEKGQIRGLIGPNGAGKSTTIKMLTGILVPTELRTDLWVDGSGHVKPQLHALPFDHGSRCADVIGRR